MKIKYKAGELAKVRKIKDLFSEIEDLINSLSYETKEQINETHTYDATIQYCSRWGEQAADELTRKENYSISKAIFE